MEIGIDSADPSWMLHRQVSSKSDSFQIGVSFVHLDLHCLEIREEEGIIWSIVPTALNLYMAAQSARIVAFPVRSETFLIYSVLEPCSMDDTW